MATYNQMQVQQKPKFSVAITTKGYQSLISNTLRDPARARRFTASITSAVAVNPALQECAPGTPTQKRYRAQNLYRLFLHVVSDSSLFLCRLNLIKQLRAGNCRRMRNNRTFRLLCAHAADRLFDLVGKALLRRRICEFFLQHPIRPI